MTAMNRNVTGRVGVRGGGPGEVDAGKGDIKEGSMSEGKKTAFLRRFMEDESGISAVEYGLLAAGIAIGLWTIIGGEGGIRESLAGIFGKVKTDLADAAP